MIQYHINVNNKIIQQQKLEKKYPRKINKNIIGRYCKINIHVFFT